MNLEFLFRRLPTDRHTALITAVILICAIATADFAIAPNVSIGLLYLFPMLIAAAGLKYVDIAAMALVCAFLRELFSPLPWSEAAVSRLITTFITYAGAAILMREMDRHRKVALARTRQLAEEVEGRQIADQQLRGLIEGMPAAIVTLDAGGRILLANEAAHELLGQESELLIGESIDKYLPDVARLRQVAGVRHLIRTTIEGTGYRHTGQAFLAEVWVSSYGSPSDTGLTAVIFDASEQLRTREEAGLHSVMSSARVMMGAFWHETRNLSSAMRVLVSILMHRSGIAESQELDGLKSLVDSLEKLAYAEQRPASEKKLDTASVRVVLDHLRIVIEPSFEEKEIALSWRIADEVPLVCADHRGLLQVFLNLARNASRALEGSERKEFTISAGVEEDRVEVRFHNSCPLTTDPDSLFKPFQPGASGGGLGLYVSRAVMQSFGGDLIYEPGADGCSFAVVLQVSQIWYTYGVGTR